MIAIPTDRPVSYRQYRHKRTSERMYWYACWKDENGKNHRTYIGNSLELTPQTGPLSRRELDILEAAACGKTLEETAQELGISNQTVKNHITSILKKLSVSNRTAAVVHALYHRWIAWPEELERQEETQG